MKKGIKAVVVFFLCISFLTACKARKSGSESDDAQESTAVIITESALEPSAAPSTTPTETSEPIITEEPAYTPSGVHTEKPYPDEFYTEDGHSCYDHYPELTENEESYEVSDSTPDPIMTAGPQPTPIGGFFETKADVYSMTADELEPYLSQVQLPEGYDEFMESIGEDRYLEDDPWHYQIFYMSTHKNVFIPGFGNPYYEDESYLDEYGEYNGNYETQFINRQVTFTYNDAGDTVTIGTDKTPIYGGIRLSAEASAAVPGSCCGFLYSADPLFCETVCDGYTPGTTTDGINAGYTNFLITNTTYDALIPSIADTDEAAGCIWAGWEPETVNMRIVNINQDRILASIYIRIDRTDSGAFAITDVGNAADLADVSEEAEEQMVDDAIRLFFEPYSVAAAETDDLESIDPDFSVIDGRGFDRPTDEQDAQMHEDYFIEKVPYMYTLNVRLPETNGTVNRSSLSEYSPFYAVSFNSFKYGYFTVYFAESWHFEDVQTETGVTPTMVYEYKPATYEIPYTATRAEYERFLEE